MTQTPSVSLVIPVYNQLMHTMQCVESIQRLPDQAAELIIIDNASTDGTSEYLKGRDLRVITNPMNLGCAKAWNQGVRASQGDIIGILNNDIVVTTGWLPALLSFMERTGCGIVSPAMREGPLDYELDRYAAEYTTACRTATRRGLRGPCMLIRRAVFDSIGLFDEGEPSMVHEMRHIIHRTRDEVIDAGHFMLKTDQSLAKMAAQKSRATRDDYPHR